MNATLNAFDFAFGTLEKVSEIDYVKAGDKVINFIVGVAAITVAIVSYLWVAVRLFWLENGETILKRAVQTVFLTVDFAGEMLIAGRDFRKFVNFVTAQVADRAFYAACY